MRRRALEWARALVHVLAITTAAVLAVLLLAALGAWGGMRP